MTAAGSDRGTQELPSALDRMEQIEECLEGRTPAIFLDYDGVLTPIVRRAEDALISPQMRQAVRSLAGLCTVAVVSGRDLQDVKQMAGIDGIVYAGSHGFDIEGPAGLHLEFQKGVEYLPALDRGEEKLSKRLADIGGVRLERKRFALAVHFREVAEQDIASVEEAVDGVVRDIRGLRKTGGKKIFELRPDIDWDKGKAVRFLMEKLHLEGPQVVPFYLGDDLTDEDAFKELKGGGVGIVVRDEERPTMADYALENPDEVRDFLLRLAHLLRRGS